MIEISIIVPVYKVEKYLNRCINSLVNQTLKNIEIILVDDGSPDSCPFLCDEWKKKDNRITVVHKKNGGLSSARNAGLEVAKGRFIGFIDSDDDIELDMFEKMYNVAKKYDVDFVMCDYQRVLSTGQKYLKTLDIDAGYYTKEKIIKDIFPNLIMRNSIDYGPLLSVWHCLYKYEFLKRNNLKFDEEVRWSEDNIFSAVLGYNTNSFYYMKGEGLYHYYENENSITTGYRQGAWDVYKTMNKNLQDYFEDKNDYDFKEQLNYHLIYYGCNCISMAVSKKTFFKIRKEIHSILQDKKLQDALKNINNLNIDKKLYFQLLLMKYKCSFLLTLLMKRRTLCKR